jgi:hypothetical protein
MGYGVAVSWGLRWTATNEEVLDLVVIVSSWSLCWIAVVACSGLGPVQAWPPPPSARLARLPEDSLVRQKKL